MRTVRAGESFLELIFSIRSGTGTLWELTADLAGSVMVIDSVTTWGLDKWLAFCGHCSLAARKGASWNSALLCGQFCSGLFYRASKVGPFQSWIPQGLGSYILRLKLFLLNRMKWHKMTEREMTPESGSLQ